MAWPRWTFLVAILLLPTVTAASGSFLVEGGTELPAGSRLAFAPSVVFLPDATRALAFDLASARATLHVFEQEMVRPIVADQGGVNHEPARMTTHPVEDLRVSFTDVSEKGGYVGVYPGNGSAATLIPSSRAFVESEKGRRVDTDAGTDRAGEDAPPLAYEWNYERTVKGPSTWVEAAGRLSYAGPGFVKIHGPDLVVTSAGRGEERIPTGMVRLDAFRTVERWVVVKMEAGSFDATAASPWIVAGPAASAAWEGEAVFRASSGTLEDARGEYAAGEGTTRLAGRFDAVFSPERHGGRLVTRMAISGDVSDTNLHLASAALAPPVGGEGGARVVLLAVAGVVVGVGAFGAGAWLAWRPRGRSVAEEPGAYTVEECMAAATAAADDEDWPRAIHWLERVRVLAPTSSRTCADLAHALSQLGRADEALRTYEEASRLSGDGEADFNGAVVAVEAGRPAEEVEAWLERALARTPAYVFDVESDPAFALLRGRARFERVVADAWTRVDDVDYPGP